MRNNGFIKVKAGALQFVVFVGLVIAVLLASFVTLTYTHKLFKNKAKITVENVKSVDFNLYAFLYNSNSNNGLNTERIVEADIQSTYWGAYEKVQLISSNKKNRFSKIALVGGIKENRPALYLKENNQPLIVVGNTVIRGDGFLPKQGVKAGNIAGNSYYGDRLVYGKIVNSNEQLPHPPVLSKLNDQLRQLEENTELAPFSLQREIQSNSFLNTTKHLYSNDIIDLTNSSLIGNIIVQSEKAIIVDPSSSLKDIILIAPKIEIRDGVISTFQAIATYSITVGKNCHLKYPSALILKPEESKGNDFESKQLYVGENSTLKGLVLYLNNTEQKNFKPQIFFEKGSRMYGEVFCEANLELKGAVYGSVYTSGFISSEFGSIYLNHLFNAEISATALHNNYVGLAFENDKKEVVKWLY